MVLDTSRLNDRWATCTLESASQQHIFFLTFSRTIGSRTCPRYDIPAATTQARNHLSETEPLKIIGTPDRNSVSNTSRVDTLNSSKRVRGGDAPGVSLVAILRGVVLRLLGLGGVEAEDAGPLLDGLLVVLGAEGGVGAAVVDLEARAGTGVAGVHVLDGVGPVLRGGLDIALGAGGVPGCGLVGGGDLCEER